MRRDTQRRQDKAAIALGDYMALGPHRSIERLAASYKERRDKGETVPSIHRTTLADWSRAYNWRGAAEEYDRAERERRHAAGIGKCPHCGGELPPPSAGSPTEASPASVRDRLIQVLEEAVPNARPADLPKLVRALAELYGLPLGRAEVDDESQRASGDLDLQGLSPQALQAIVAAGNALGGSAPQRAKVASPEAPESLAGGVVT